MRSVWSALDSYYCHLQWQKLDIDRSELHSENKHFKSCLPVVLRTDHECIIGTGYGAAAQS